MGLCRLVCQGGGWIQWFMRPRSMIRRRWLKQIVDFPTLHPQFSRSRLCLLGKEWIWDLKSWKTASNNWLWKITWRYDAICDMFSGMTLLQKTDYQCVARESVKASWRNQREYRLAVGTKEENNAYFRFRFRFVGGSAFVYWGWQRICESENENKDSRRWRVEHLTQLW